MKNKNLQINSEYYLRFRKANLYSGILSFFLFLIPMLVYHSIWTAEESSIKFAMVKDSFLCVFATGIVLHEILHGFTWALFAKTGIKAIKFGFKWKYLTPYCHCYEKLKVKHYKLGAAMPLVVMGLIPSAYSIIVGNGIVFFYGIALVCISAGDILVLLKLRKLNNEQYIKDHPYQMGFCIE